jgi:hypothetical protein
MASLVSSLLLLLALSQAEPRQCGYDRWPVKILADRDAGRVSLTPASAPVSQLAALPIKEAAYPKDARLEPEELKTYMVRARFVSLRREQDHDLHLLIEDLKDSSARIVAEIPAPECVKSRGDDYAKAREVARGLKRGDELEIVGVGFFDFVHNPPVAAKNGFELHPVLSLRIINE